MGRLLKTPRQPLARPPGRLPAAGLTFEAPSPYKVTITLTRARVQEVAHTFAGLPLLRQREKVVETLGADLLNDYTTAVRRHLQEMTDDGENLRNRRRELELEAARLDDYAAYARDVMDLDLEDHRAVAGLERGPMPSAPWPPITAAWAMAWSSAPPRPQG